MYHSKKTIEMNYIKPIRIYLLAVLLILGFYTYSVVFGVAFLPSSVVRDTEYAGNNHAHGVHVFYHK